MITLYIGDEINQQYVMQEVDVAKGGYLARDLFQTITPREYQGQWRYYRFEDGSVVGPPIQPGDWVILRENDSLGAIHKDAQ